MADYKKREEDFKKKYGYLISNHPIEYAVIYFLVFFGALSLVQDVSLKLGFNLFADGWYKYIFCTMITGLHVYYRRKIARRDYPESEK